MAAFRMLSIQHQHYQQLSRSRLQQCQQPVRGGNLTVTVHQHQPVIQRRSLHSGGNCAGELQVIGQQQQFAVRSFATEASGGPAVWLGHKLPECPFPDTPANPQPAACGLW